VDFHLADGDLKDFREAFKVGNVWSWLREDAEAMRYWHVLSETAPEVRMHHGTGAFAVLSITDDRITDISLLQGSEAEGGASGLAGGSTKSRQVPADGQDGC